MYQSYKSDTELKRCHSNSCLVKLLSEVNAAASVTLLLVGNKPSMTPRSLAPLTQTDSL